MRVAKDRRPLATLIGISILAGAYFYGVFKESLWSDDYVLLLNAREDPTGSLTFLVSLGRPLLGVLLGGGYRLTDSAENAWMLRFVSWLALVFVFLMVAHRLRGAGRRSTLAILVAAIGLCLPTFTMYVDWAGAWPFASAMLLGVFAQTLWRRGSKCFRLLGIALLAVAFLIYPPAALFFLGLSALQSSVFRSSTAEMVRTLRSDALLVGLSLVSSFSFAALIIMILQIQPSARATFVSLTDSPEKGWWFVTRVIVTAFRPFAIDSPTVGLAIATTIPVAVVVLLGLFVQARSMRENIFVRGLAYAGFLILSCAPLLLASQNQFEFRMVPTITWGIFTLAFSALAFALFSTEVRAVPHRAWYSRTSHVLGVGLIVSMSAIGVFTANVRYLQLIGEPYDLKQRFLTESLAQCPPEALMKRVVILPPREEFKYLERLGDYSQPTDLMQPWVPEPNVRLLLDSMGFNPVVEYKENRLAVAELPQGTCVVDLEGFRSIIEGGSAT